MKTKLDFTKDKLNIIVLELANLNGYEKPSTYLNDLLNEVKGFKSFDFECDFFLNIHSLCKENLDKFWSESHKKDIISWLKTSRILTDVFDTTFEPLQLQNPINKKRPPAKYYALLHKIKIDLGIENNFKFNAKGQNERPTIEKFAEDNYGFIKGQGFYRAFTDPNINNKALIAKQYGNGYKEKLIKLSNNDDRIIQELKKYSN